MTHNILLKMARFVTATDIDLFFILSLQFDKRVTRCVGEREGMEVEEGGDISITRANKTVNGLKNDCHHRYSASLR